VLRDDMSSIKEKVRINPLIVLFSYNILYMAAAGLIVPGVPLYLATNGFSEDVVNLVLASTALASLVGQVIFGYVSDRVMTKSFFVGLGTISYIFGYLTLALLKNKLLSVFILVILNFFGSAAYPAAMALLADFSSVQNRGRSMGFFWSSASLGWAISVAFTGLILERFGGSYLFGICSLMHSVSFLLIYFGFRGYDKKVKIEDPSTKVRGSIFKSILSLEGSFLVFLVGTLIFFMADFTKNVYIPMFYTFELGLGITTSTLLLSFTSWIELPSTVFFGYLSDKIGRKKVILIGYMLCIIFMVINSLAYNFWSATFAMGLYGLIWGAFSGASSALASELTSENERGFAMGLFNSSGSIANLIAPLSIGVLIQLFGYRLAFVTLSMLLLVACLLLIFRVKEKTNNPKNESRQK
jgi:MFS family permease